MQTITFDDLALATLDPTYQTKDNTISFTGTAGLDLLNLADGQALVQNLLLNPISWTFSKPVSSVSFGADILGLGGSTTVSYYDENGNLLHTDSNNTLGEQDFTYANPDIGR